MNRFSYIIFLCVLLGLSSCTRMPDHAHLIPKDALVVVGINTKEIGKKIAWNAIMGNKLLSDMQKEKTGNAITDPEQIGVELMSTSYVYMKTDKRFSNGSRITALVPLKDAGKWESFIKTTFPEALVKQQKGHKDAQLADGMYAGWTDELLVIMNTLDINQSYTEITSVDTINTHNVLPAPAIDETQLLAEMDKAFNTAKENALSSDKRFTEMEKDAHDITLWINYDAVMEQYMGGEGSNLMGLSLSNTLWKHAALSAGFDFEKGKIAGDMLYYVPDGLKQAAEELGKTNADKELVERMPGQNLDMLMAWHIAPNGVKSLLEKTGVLGFINLALMGEDLSADFILEAFTGDMAVALNDFTLKADTAGFHSPNSDSTGTSYSGDMHFTYAVKINKKENFEKLLRFGVSSGNLNPLDNNTYQWKNGEKPVTMAIRDNYCVITNHPPNAVSYLEGDFKKQAKPEDASVIYGNPFGIYFNAQGLMNALDPATSASAKDSAMLAESKKLLKNIYFKGGDFKFSAFRYDMSINFINSNENTLLQLIEFGIHMTKSNKEALTASK